MTPSEGGDDQTSISNRTGGGRPGEVGEECPGSGRPPAAEAILVGYGHAAILDTLRPGKAHRRARSAITLILSEPCACADDHVEIWARHVP